jgi:hypothetical protein
MTEEQSPVSCHAPLHAAHPVIPARQAEAPPCPIGRSVVTGSSAYADDDDREKPGPILRRGRYGLVTAR